MSITLTIADTANSMTFDGGQAEILTPLVSNPVIRETDVETINGDISTYYSSTKRQYSIQLGYLDRESYATLIAFRDRMYQAKKYPLITIDGDPNINVTELPMKLTINAQNVVNNCGEVENVTITLRESKQMP